MTVGRGSHTNLRKKFDIRRGRQFMCRTVVKMDIPARRQSTRFDTKELFNYGAGPIYRQCREKKGNISIPLFVSPGCFQVRGDFFPRRQCTKKFGHCHIFSHSLRMLCLQTALEKNMKRPQCRLSAKKWLLQPRFNSQTKTQRKK